MFEGAYSVTHADAVNPMRTLIFGNVFTVLLIPTSRIACYVGEHICVYSATHVVMLCCKRVFYIAN